MAVTKSRRIRDGLEESVRLKMDVDPDLQNAQ
jgi:hypothetical protein